MNSRVPTRFPRSIRRTAMLLMSVLIVLAFVIVVSTVLLRNLALERSAVRALEVRVQAAYLADAGLLRAQARLDRDAGYVGETWRIAAESLAMRGAATVEIHVETIADQPGTRRVTAVADFPAEGERRARRTREIKIVASERRRIP